MRIQTFISNLQVHFLGERTVLKKLLRDARQFCGVAIFFIKITNL
jgi:hypothetical protein